MPKHGPRVGVCFHLHPVQRLGVSSPPPEDSRQSQLLSPMLVLIPSFVRLYSHKCSSFITLSSLDPAPLLDFGPPVPAAQPSTDMWGDFTSAASKWVRRPHTCAVAPSADVCRVCVHCTHTVPLFCCPWLFSPPSACSPQLQSRSRQTRVGAVQLRPGHLGHLGHWDTLAFYIPAICCSSGSHLLLQTKHNNGTKPNKCIYFIFWVFSSLLLLLCSGSFRLWHSSHCTIWNTVALEVSVFHLATNQFADIASYYRAIIC